ncbi:MAG: RluA family pseudouridine synthase [Pirellulaceae bacterium]
MASDESHSQPVDVVISSEHAGRRLDAFLAEYLPRYSRAYLKKAMVHAGVEVNGNRVKVAYRLKEGQRVTFTPPELPQEGPQPEAIPLDVLYEDDQMVAINKPANMVVHPGKGHWSGTLAAALAFRFEHLSSAGGATRPGIVHRLDRATSGVIVVAKTDRAHLALAAQFESRAADKEYLAIVAGSPDRDRDLIEQPIGAHPHQREKMAIRADHSTSRAARSFYEVLDRFPGFAVVRVTPKTGRTHQIRVHLAHIRCPVLCDRLYGGRSQITLGELTHTNDDTVLLARHALHARRLTLCHPTRNERIEFQAPVPHDMQTVIAALSQQDG